jgi:hypothetical protein
MNIWDLGVLNRVTISLGGVIPKYSSIGKSFAKCTLRKRPKKTVRFSQRHTF